MILVGVEEYAQSFEFIRRAKNLSLHSSLLRYPHCHTITMQISLSMELELNFNLLDRSAPRLGEIYLINGAYLPVGSCQWDLREHPTRARGQITCEAYVPGQWSVIYSVVWFSKQTCRPV